jgi:UDP:flavonoid glycosyltransferase YjiC (YdhE family)
MPEDVNPSALRRGLRRVLELTSYRQSARLIAEEISSMPSPGEVAGQLGGGAAL